MYTYLHFTVLSKPVYQCHFWNVSGTTRIKVKAFIYSRYKLFRPPKNCTPTEIGVTRPNFIEKAEIACRARSIVNPAQIIFIRYYVKNDYCFYNCFSSSRLPNC